MKKGLFLLFWSVFFIITAHSQVNIVQENFGSGFYSGDLSAYTEYTSDAEFGGDNPHMIQDGNSAGYPDASGGAAVLMGNWNTPPNETFVMEYSTEGYTSVRLSFGIKHNSGGWGPCTLTDNFIRIEYSTDSSSWTTIDKAYLLEGSSWPCADENKWGFIELGTILPSSPNLVIRFTHTSPAIHPFHLDDITLSGYPPDNNPPSAPTNLVSQVLDFKSFVLQWNAATDDVGIKFYEIMRDGRFLTSTLDTFAMIDFQVPGSTAEFSVVAYDVAENPSPASSVLQVTLDQKPLDYLYSWQKPQASVLPSGDIEWTPEQFAYEAGSSVRYIDYESGDDTNDGLSTATPWKHHPWDDEATDNAEACSGIHTYVFKRGVIYRGQLTAAESGTPLEPIRLTSDPGWGSGKAYFLGSKRYEGGWTQADATTAPNIPEPEKVWYRDGWLPETKMVVEMDGEDFNQLHVARTPNYKFTEDDLLSSWYSWTSDSEVAEGGRWLRDDDNLTNDDPDYLAGATVWSNEDAIVMCTMWGQDVQEWDPDNNRVRVSNDNFGGKGTKYYVENSAFLLDTVNEFFYDADLQRLYVRLEGDKDPNTTMIEVATKTELININSKSNIVISGLTFGVTTAHNVRYGTEDTRSTIRMTGINSNIEIRNNEFWYVNGAVSLKNDGSSTLNTTSITIADNNLQVMGDHGIVVAGGTYADDINILRNNIYNNGYRHQGRWYSSVPAIFGQLNYGEIAGNVINYSMGNGIDLFWGKGGGSSAYVPFIRGLVHHNKAANTLMGTNDYGGIESWQGGPAFVYNNYSHNGLGYKHYNNSSIGYTYYFDGAFKHIVFNNIASGLSADLNSASIMQVLGFYNMYVHNSGYNTNIFLNAWKGTLALDGQNSYLSNATQDVPYFFRHELETAYLPHEAYGYNVAAGAPFQGTLENRDNIYNLEQFRSELEGYDAVLTQTGWNASADIFADPANTDFSPAANSEVVGRGVRFFTAFPLAKVVGEWNFYKNPSDPSKVLGENFYMTPDFNDRTTYNEVPKNHMTVHEIVDSSFVQGDLEDWTEGALVFDGAVYGEVSHETATANMSNDIDMTFNDFIIEIYLKTETGHTGGALVSKFGTAEGYELTIDASGHAKMALYVGGAEAVSRTSTDAINDGEWHHLLVEVDRKSDIRIYLDGDLNNGSMSGTMPDDELELTNSSNLLIGKDADNHYFRGQMDFLRISRGSLYEAKTTVDELYTWNTDGPFLYDMLGKEPQGQRDAGAIETGEVCALSLSETSFEFDYTGGSAKIIVNAEDVFAISGIDGDFFETTIDQDSIFLEVGANDTITELTGSFMVVGCNTMVMVSIIQDGAPCSFECSTSTLDLSGEEQTIKVEVLSNGPLSAASDMSFVTVALVGDSVVIDVDENKTGAERTATVEITSCDGVHSIDITQQTLTGIFNHGLNSGLTIYPNPVSGQYIFLGLPVSVDRCEYAITDLSGKVMQNGLIHSTDEGIELDLDPGTYLLKVTGREARYVESLIVL